MQEASKALNDTDFFHDHLQQAGIDNCKAQRTTDITFDVINKVREAQSKTIDSIINGEIETYDKRAAKILDKQDNDFDDDFAFPQYEIEELSALCLPYQL